MIILKELIFLSFATLEKWHGLEISILTLSVLEGVVVLKEPILTVSSLTGCGGLERTDL